MPTTRTYRSRIAGQATLSEAAIRYLRDEHHWDGLSLFGVNELCHLGRHGDVPYHLQGDAAREVSGLSSRELVEQYGDKYLKAFVAEQPGRRPAWWRRFNTLDNGERLLRQRIGGVGETASDRWVSHGVPGDWITAADKIEDRTRPGRPLASGIAVDPANPPTFESEAAYLDRQGLLLAGERKRLSAVDFAPEAVAVDDDDDE
jgi:hypothetical protein